MQQLLVIPTRERHVGWPVSALAEITAVPEVQALPAPFPHLAGTAFHRGKVLTVANLWSVAGLCREEEAPAFSVRMAAPHDHLAVLIPGVQTVLPYSPLDLREEVEGGLWAGLFPWGEIWVSVINPGTVVRELATSMAEYLRSPTGGRSHAS